MRKVLALLVAGLFLVFLAQEFGLVRLPYTAGQAVEATQRAFGRRRQAERIEDIPVLTARVTRRDAPVTIDAVGSVQSLASVVVRAQVEGRLNEIRFRDGQDVAKGDVLAVIDARTYQAAFDQASAKKAQDSAQLANARLDLERAEKLAAASFGSRQQLDTARASVAQLEALLQVDDAIIENARITLDHATIRAPISGRTGLRAIDAGNLVRTADFGLVTITQMQPIGAIFALPQQNLGAVNIALGRGKLKAVALDADNATVLETGEVETLDNQVDPATGTVRIRAIFPNAQKLLWPGQFINIRIEVDVDRQALTAPTAAVQRGPNGAFVYVVR
ncbi:MAG: multidrug resistance protein MdtA, partial [Hyphomicrobiales bacterium]|nr:multidrug resistance protein MdtA [Hyphomicrobiales bacterium]